VRANPLLYGAVALALVLIVAWLALQPLAAMIQQVLGQGGDVAQVTPTPLLTPPFANEPASATEAVAPAGILPTPTPTPDLPSDLVQPPTTAEPLAASTPVVPGGEAPFDLRSYLSQTNRPELAELEVSAILQGTTLKLRGIVSLFDQREALIQLAQRVPEVTTVDGVDLLIRLPESYTVQEGDSLWLISYKLYGEDRVAELYAANRDTLPSPEALRVGQTLKVPPKE
jgi:nucleoid-associated protein YgaU